ncbi:hypothetical protein C8J56DRAFT_1131207 [Mycena floridula]|nr:hypothetical protein C8J56DRAFT_1131207 [Mycena floridula]
MSMGCIKCGFSPAQDPVLSISATAREQLFHHSRENVLPTEVEILETKANITVERSAIKLLKQRISDLQQEVEIRELNLEHYRTIISPIRRIPNEILGGIFQDAVDDAVSEMSSTPFDQRVPPWPLALVCSHWRQVTLSSMSLWATIYVNLTEVPSHYHGGVNNPWLYIPQAREYLRRSGDHPLKIILHHTRGVSPQPLCERLLGLFLEHSTRWLDVKLDLDALALEMAASRVTEFSMMRCLEIIVWHSNLRPNVSTIDINAPKLEELIVYASLPPHLRLRFPSSPISSVELGWAVSLTQNFVLDTEGLRLLRLRQFRRPEKRRVDVFAGVTSLGWSCGEGFSVLDDLTLPAVQELISYDMVEWPDIEQPAFEKFLHRSRCLVTTFRVTCRWDLDTQHPGCSIFASGTDCLGFEFGQVE